MTTFYNLLGKLGIKGPCLYWDISSTNTNTYLWDMQADIWIWQIGNTGRYLYISYVCGLPDLTVGTWQVEDTLDSDEEVGYMVADGADPCPSM